MPRAVLGACFKKKCTLYHRFHFIDFIQDAHSQSCHQKNPHRAPHHQREAYDPSRSPDVGYKPQDIRIGWAQDTHILGNTHRRPNPNGKAHHPTAVGFASQATTSPTAYLAERRRVTAPATPARATHSIYEPSADRYTATAPHTRQDRPINTVNLQK